jgi:NADH dehydrogenase [ubiquinone] 1 alpha subcomplex assembly factor 6
VYRYAENTASSLMYLTLEALGIRDNHADHAASHVGKALGIVTLLRGTRFHAAQDSLYIPVDLQREYKVTATDVLRGPQTPEAAQALADVFYEIASHAHVHLEHARHMLPSAPPGTHAALLPGVRAAMYLEALQKANFNALDEGLEPRNHFTFQLRLFWANFRGKV